MDTTILPQENRTFVLHPLVGKAAMKLGYEQAYRWYLALRGSKRDGICHLTRSEVIQVFEGFGWDRTQYYRLIKDKGFSTFFHVDTIGNVRFYSIEKVCRNLGTPTGYPVEISAQILKGNISKFRAAIYASGFSKERTVSRGKLNKEYGISHNTQRKYERENGVEVHKNFAVADASAYEILPIPEDAYTWDQKGTACVFWQLPNTYRTTEFLSARPGQAKRIGKAMRRILSNGVEVERRRRFLIRNWKGDLRGEVMLDTEEQFYRVLRSGTLEFGSLYEYRIFTVKH